MTIPSHPKLRWPLELRLEKIENQEILLIRCPAGLSERPLLLVPQVAPIVSCMDGQMSIDEIQTKFAEHGIKRELIVELVTLLDDHLFLSGDKFSAAERKVRQDFLALEHRPAFMSGLAYANNKADLQLEIAGYLSLAGKFTKNHNDRMACLVAPHIDYRRGKVCYGHAYSKLVEEQHDLYVLIGTSHQYSSNTFHLTKKHFDGPLGRLPTDVELVAELATKYGSSRSFADEFLHRREHSLELQVPFLSYLKPGAQIVPVLVGSFHHMLNNPAGPSAFEEYESFAASLTTCLAERISSGKKVCFIAGVDMAHIGREFGDPGSLSPEKMQKIELRDKQYLAKLMAQDAPGLFEHIAEDEDERRICGFPTMHTVLDVLTRLNIKTRGEVFDYRQAVDYQSDCAVTFAGIGLYKSQ